MRIAVALILLVPLAGCTDPVPEAHTGCMLDADWWAMYDTRWPLDRGTVGPETDPDDPWQTVALVQGDGVFLTGTTGAEVERLDHGDRSLGIISVPPATPAAKVAVADTQGTCTRFPTIDFRLSEPRQGAEGQTGKGVVVHTAGFWENGTLFYTNIDGVDRSDWPRASWYAPDASGPLQVYVYDTDRSERPPTWGVSDADPLLGPTGIGSTAYHTTIPGFNEALQGISTATTKVVRIPPEQAYTRTGYEDHPLYGDALVFVIQAVAVAEAPCPYEGYSEDGPCFSR